MGAFYTIAELPVDDTEFFAKWMLENFRIDNETTMVTPAASFYKTPGKGMNHARIAYVLEIDEMKKVYNTVLQAQLSALDFVAAGKIGKDCDKVARDIIYGAGYEGCFGHSLGHGVGMFIHEEPRLASSWDKPLEVGAIVTVEPGIYIEGKYGVRIEDMVWLSKDGTVNLTKAPKELVELF